MSARLDGSWLGLHVLGRGRQSVQNTWTGCNCLEHEATCLNGNPKSRERPSQAAGHRDQSALSPINSIR